MNNQLEEKINNGLVISSLDNYVRLFFLLVGYPIHIYYQDIEDQKKALNQLEMYQTEEGNFSSEMASNL